MEFFLIVDLYIFKSCEIHYLKKTTKKSNKCVLCAPRVVYCQMQRNRSIMIKDKGPRVSVEKQKYLSWLAGSRRNQPAWLSPKITNSAYPISIKLKLQLRLMGMPLLLQVTNHLMVVLEENSGITKVIKIHPNWNVNV